MDSNEIMHFGIKGQKWGRRRWQNPDGSLTREGYIHYYGTKEEKKAAKEQKKAEDYTKRAQATITKLGFDKAYDAEEAETRARKYIDGYTGRVFTTGIAGDLIYTGGVRVKNMILAAKRKKETEKEKETKTETETEAENKVNLLPFPEGKTNDNKQSGPGNVKKVIETEEAWLPIASNFNSQSDADKSFKKTLDKAEKETKDFISYYSSQNQAKDAKILSKNDLKKGSKIDQLMTLYEQNASDIRKNLKEKGYDTTVAEKAQKSFEKALLTYYSYENAMYKNEFKNPKLFSYYTYSSNNPVSLNNLIPKGSRISSQLDQILSNAKTSHDIWYATAAVSAATDAIRDYLEEQKR